jgi:hypothetical protein
MRPSVSTTSTRRDPALIEGTVRSTLGIAGLRFIASALRSRAEVAIHSKAAEHMRAMVIASRNFVSAAGGR